MHLTPNSFEESVCTSIHELLHLPRLWNKLNFRSQGNEAAIHLFSVATHYKAAVTLGIHKLRWKCERRKQTTKANKSMGEGKDIIDK